MNRLPATLTTKWPKEADDQARAILGNLAQDLYDESFRIARRHESDSVASAWVKQAATHIGIRRPTSRLGDVFLAVGPALAGLAGGVGTTAMTSSGGVEISGWITAASIAIGSFGMLLTGAGIALKIRR